MSVQIFPEALYKILKKPLLLNIDQTSYFSFFVVRLPNGY